MSYAISLPTSWPYYLKGEEGCWQQQHQANIHLGWQSFKTLNGMSETKNRPKLLNLLHRLTRGCTVMRICAWDASSHTNSGLFQRCQVNIFQILSLKGISLIKWARVVGSHKSIHWEISRMRLYGHNRIMHMLTIAVWLSLTLILLILNLYI